MAITFVTENGKTGVMKPTCSAKHHIGKPLSQSIIEQGGHYFVRLLSPGKRVRIFRFHNDPVCLREGQELVETYLKKGWKEYKPPEK